jgi:DNA damage-binding protein 1
VIAIADLMKSVSIVEYKVGENGLPDTLDEVARHFQTVWSTAVAHIAEDTFLESDAEGNLIVLHQNRNGVTTDDQRRLEVTSEMQLGEMVNRIRRINVPVASDAVVIPRAFLGTVDGAIYLFALISPKSQDLLMKLQACMGDHVESLGRIPLNMYRAFRSSVREAEEPFRFIDGEFIEKFLGCSDELQSTITKGLGVGVDEVRAMVEGLRRLR